MTGVFDAYAEYFDVLYKDKDYVEESKYVMSLLKEHDVTGGHILELGCGTGLHAQSFAQAGFKVTAIDRSEAMIKEALGQVPKALSEAIDFAVEGIQTFKSDTKFDAIVALFHVASYLTSDEDQDSMFELASLHLKDNGVLLFDFWHGPGVLNEIPTIRVRRGKSDTAQVFRVSEPSIDVTTNTVNVTFSVFVTELESKATVQILEEHKMRYLFINEIDAKSKSNGLRLVKTNGWLSDKPADLNTWQAVSVCRKVTD